jgi:hypothetical protein
MTGAEIETIVENLFVGNRLARGEMEIDGLPVDLRNITQPVVVFASWGDNITPPPQALDWIIDTWGDEKAIAAAGRTIVYVLHEHIGHLGIFVGGEIARKEHDQIVGSMDAIAALPPGLYEMRVERKDGRNVERWDELEPGSYTVEFDRRTMDDLRELNPEGRDEEQIFSTVAQLSEINSAIYKTWVRPVLKPIASRLLADGLTHAHPLRWQRQWLSDVLPGATVLEQWAERIRADRHALPKQHPAHLFDAEISRLIESGLDLYRDLRDQAVVGWTRLAFGPLGLGAFLLPKPSDAARAAERAAGDLARHRHEVMPHLAEGGFARAVCRIVLAGMQEQGGFERRSLRLAQLLTHLAPHAGEAAAADSTDSTDATDWAELVREEARVLAVAPLDALNAVIEMLPTPDLRERALAVAAAVLMIHPSEQSPQYDVVRRLMVYLGARPRRVYELAQALVQPIEAALQGEVAQEGAITAPVAVKAAKRVRQATAQAADVARPAAKKPVVTKAGATKAGATKAATRKATTVKAAAEPAAAVTAPAKKAPKKAPEGATKDALKQAPKQAPKEAAPAKKPAAKKSAPAA